MTTFVIMQTRIASELRRSNLTTEIKAAINDAIKDAAKDRFFFNEVKGQTFATVAATEYYSDLSLTEVDAMYYFQGTFRYNMDLESNLDADAYAEGNVSGGQLRSYSRHASQFRLYPVPASVVTVYVDGYGRMTPSPLVNDADTNAWFTEGERYIRALAKSILLKDVIRDMSEAAVYEAIADDYRTSLVEQTTLRIGTGQITPTQF